MKSLKILSIVIFLMSHSYAQERSFEVTSEFKNIVFEAYEGNEGTTFISNFFHKYLKGMNLFEFEGLPFDEEEEEDLFKMLGLLLENTSQHNKYEDKRGLISIRLEGEDLILRVANPHESKFPEKIKDQKFYASKTDVSFQDVDNFIPEDQRGPNSKFGIAIGLFLSDLNIITNDNYNEDIYAHFYEDVDPDTWDKLFNVEIVFPKVRKNCTSLSRSFFEENPNGKKRYSLITPQR